MESTVVKTSVNQPTTLVVKPTEDEKIEITWNKDEEPVKHLVLQDGSLYISNTSLNDEGEYTVIAKDDEKTVAETLQLTVVDPQLPSG